MMVAEKGASGREGGPDNTEGLNLPFEKIKAEKPSVSKEFGGKFEYPDSQKERKNREKLKNEFREYLFKLLEGSESSHANKVLISRRSEEPIVVDVEGFRDGIAELLSEKRGRFLGKFREFGGMRQSDVLTNAFMEVPVISQEDYENNRQAESSKEKIPPRDLIYIPDDAQSAYDPEKIAAKKFYLGLWEVGRNQNREKNQITLSGEQIPYEEATLAAMIYHPDYGRGYRDESGVLQVYWSSIDEFKPISTTWFREEMKFGRTGGRAISLVDRPSEFLTSRAKGLVERGLLTPEDFKRRGTKEEKEKNRRRRGIGPNGFVMIDGVNYYIGKSPEFREGNVYKISSELGGVAIPDGTGEERLQYIFPLISDPAAEGLGSWTDKARRHYYTTKEQTKLKPFNRDDFFEKRADESEREYKWRIEAMVDFDYLIKFSNQVSKEAGINLSNLSFEEQIAVSYMMKNIDRDGGEIIDFIKTYGENGLRSLISAEYGSRYGDVVLDVARQINKKEATDLFRNYAELARLAGRVSAVISESSVWKNSRLPESVKKSAYCQIGEAVTRRAKGMFLVAREVAEQGKAETNVYGQYDVECHDVKEVAKALQIYRESLEKLIALLGESKKYEAISLNKVTGDMESYHFELRGTDNNTPLSYMAVQLRERGVEPDQADHERAFDGQARVNFLFSNQLIPENIQNSVRREALSIRIDREGRIEQDGNLSFNDTMEAGTVSLDAGSLVGDADLDNAVLGRVIALGNSLESKYTDPDKDRQYFHNRESFSRDLGKADVFKEMVTIIRRMMNKKYGFTG